MNDYSFGDSFDTKSDATAAVSAAGLPAYVTNYLMLVIGNLPDPPKGKHVKVSAQGSFGGIPATEAASVIVG